MEKKPVWSVFTEALGLLMKEPRLALPSILSYVFIPAFLAVGISSVSLEHALESLLFSGSWILLLLVLMLYSFFEAALIKNSLYLSGLGKISLYNSWKNARVNYATLTLVHAFILFFMIGGASLCFRFIPKAYSGIFALLSILLFETIFMFARFEVVRGRKLVYSLSKSVVLTTYNLPYILRYFATKGLLRIGALLLCIIPVIFVKSMLSFFISTLMLLAFLTFRQSYFILSDAIVFKDLDA
jgi:hypothetical protein